MTPQSEDIPTGTPVSPRDQFLLNMALESFKQSAPALNDVLGKLLTLTTTLIGAGLVAVKEGLFPFWGGFLAVLVMFAALVATLAGLIPREWRVAINRPADIARAETAVLRWKSRCLQAAFGLLAGAIALALGGMAWARF